MNRTENVRPIAPGDADVARLYARRNDAGSINCHLDDTLWLGRAHSLGHACQLVNLIGFALAVNSIAGLPWVRRGSGVGREALLVR